MIRFFFSTLLVFTSIDLAGQHSLRIATPVLEFELNEFDDSTKIQFKNNTDKYLILPVVRGKLMYRIQCSTIIIGDISGVPSENEFTIVSIAPKQEYSIIELDKCDFNNVGKYDFEINYCLSTASDYLISYLEFLENSMTVRFTYSF